MAMTSDGEARKSAGLSNLLAAATLAVTLLSLTPAVQAIETPYAVFGDGDGVAYAINSAGTLLWYRHDGRMTGVGNFTAHAVVGDGWQKFTKAFSGGDGVVYGIDGDGVLWWYRHDGRFNGDYQWASAGKAVGTGWNVFTHVFSGGDGVIYGVLPNGDLLWYRHTGWLDGKKTWVSGTGKRVGLGWNVFTKVFSGDDGVIYAIQADGVLKWYRHNGRLNGVSQWANNGIGKPVGGPGWQNFRQVFSSGDGIIYAADNNGSLLWYRHKGWLSGADSWVSLTGTAVGNGWLFP
jgi:hypothetical protein